MNSAIHFHQVSKHYGKVAAVDNVDLEIMEGEFFAMLGPSGSGKTTCLRLIAGFEQVSSGNIEIFGQSVSEVPPNRRQVNTVFQNYALFPHLSILDNVAFPLRIKKMDKKTRYQKAEEMLELVRLSGYGNRRTTELSGGQRQRVALARALISQPKVLLLDEPLGALDLKLREEMQIELRELQHHLKTTFVFVTHDQDEAMSMADRIAIFSEGKIQQVDIPERIYNFPRTPFIADFVGHSNVLPSEFVGYQGEEQSVSLRPEKVILNASSGKTATVISTTYIGRVRRVRLSSEGQELTALIDASNAVPNVGENLTFTWQPEDVHPLEG